MVGGTVISRSVATVEASSGMSCSSSEDSFLAAVGGSTRVLSGVHPGGLLLVLIV